MGLKEQLKNIVILDSADKLKQPINSFVGYEYIVAGNGVFIRAENQFFRVCFQIAECDIRNLLNCEEYFAMKNGKMPLEICEAIKNEIENSDTEKEKFLQVLYTNGEYTIFIPEQKGTGTAVKYESQEQNVILEVHTHPEMSAFFSDIDDRDEKGFRLYGVFSVIDGKVDEFILRISVYGYYKMLPYYEIAEELDV